MDIIVGVIIGVIALTILVVAHEMGHALVARRNGVVVEEFGIGFPPKAWGKKLKKSILGNNVLYSINWLPLGGFVKLQGEHDAATGKGDYGAATFWQKTKILLAGVAANWVVAVLLFTVLALVGLPKMLPNQFTVPGDTAQRVDPVEVTYVVEGSPAADIGLKARDRILQLGSDKVENSDKLSQLTEKNKGKRVALVYERSGVQRTAEVKLNADNSSNKGYLGVNHAQQEFLRSTWSAPIVGVGTTVQLSYETIKGIGDLLVKSVRGFVLQFSGNADVSKQAKSDLAEAGDGVAGPVGIFGTLFPAASKAGLVHILLITAILSLTLAVMNILPIPALDGGRWFVTALYKLRGKPLTKEIEEKIHGTGFMVLMLLVILVTIADVGRFVK